MAGRASKEIFIGSHRCCCLTYAAGEHGRAVPCYSGRLWKNGASPPLTALGNRHNKQTFRTILTNSFSSAPQATARLSPELWKFSICGLNHDLGSQARSCASVYFKRRKFHLYVTYTNKLAALMFLKLGLGFWVKVLGDRGKFYCWKGNLLISSNPSPWVGGTELQTLLFPEQNIILQTHWNINYNEDRAC